MRERLCSISDHHHHPKKLIKQTFKLLIKNSSYSAIILYYTKLEPQLSHSLSFQRFPLLFLYQSFPAFPAFSQLLQSIPIYFIKN